MTAFFLGVATGVEGSVEAVRPAAVRLGTTCRQGPPLTSSGLEGGGRVVVPSMDGPTTDGGRISALSWSGAPPSHHVEKLTQLVLERCCGGLAEWFHDRREMSPPRCPLAGVGVVPL